ncbi:MAG: putative quinol monooxygenase [Pseudomonas sp.]|nr:putative quinol monooxygenase [Pseudomonas sp.]
MPDLHGFILHAHTRPEKAAEFEALFRAYVEPSRAETGCIEYHMLRDHQDPTLFIFYEVWQSPEHLAIHSALPHMRRFYEQRMDYLRRDFEIRRIEMLSPAKQVADNSHLSVE